MLGSGLQTKLSVCLLRRQVSRLIGQLRLQACLLVRASGARLPGQVALCHSSCIFKTRLTQLRGRPGRLIKGRTISLRFDNCSSVTAKSTSRLSLGGVLVLLHFSRSLDVTKRRIDDASLILAHVVAKICISNLPRVYPFGRNCLVRYVASIKRACLHGACRPNVIDTCLSCADLISAQDPERPYPIHSHLPILDHPSANLLSADLIRVVLSNVSCR